MTIYFYDGMLPESLKSSMFYVDAAWGHSDCDRQVRALMEAGDYAVLTNYTYLLSPEFCYNKSEHRFDAYIWSSVEGKWKQIQTLTDKELRYGHNIERLYRNGEFGDCSTVPSYDSFRLHHIEDTKPDAL